MPSSPADNRLLYIATFKSQVGDIASINVQAIRMYEVEVSFLFNAPMRQAIQFSHGFLDAMTICEDFLDFAELMTAVPLSIAKGSQLPVAAFMESPFTNIAYHTFEEDYFLNGIEQYPYAHVVTGISFPFTLTAQLVLDATLKYKKKAPVQKHPAKPFNYERYLYDTGWVVDYPELTAWNQTETRVSFARNTGGEYHNYRLYTDCVRLYEGVLFTEEQMQYHALYAPHGIKFDGSRYYYYGNDQPIYQPDFPYKSIEPVPSTSIYNHTTPGWESVSGMLWGYTTENPILAYPPEGQDPLRRTGRPFLLDALPFLGLLSGTKIYFREAGINIKIDGSWALGDGTKIDSVNLPLDARWRIGWEGYKVGGKLWR